MIPRLTPRQRSIVQGLANGRAEKQIAHSLGITPGTVRNHTTFARRKVQAETNEHLVALALRSGQIA